MIPIYSLLPFSNTRNPQIPNQSRFQCPRPRTRVYILLANRKPLTSIVQFVPARSRFVVVFVQSQCEGFAYVGGACVVNKRLEKVNSVAIIEDTGGFSGIIVAAHEVGHL